LLGKNSRGNSKRSGEKADVGAGLIESQKGNNQQKF